MSGEKKEVVIISGDVETLADRSLTCCLVAETSARESLGEGATEAEVGTLTAKLVARAYRRVLRGWTPTEEALQAFEKQMLLEEPTS